MARVTIKYSTASVCPVDCGKTADWIWMSFGIIGRVGPRMCSVGGVLIAPREGIILGVDMAALCNQWGSSGVAV